MDIVIVWLLFFFFEIFVVEKWYAYEKKRQLNEVNPCLKLEKKAVICILYSWGVLFYYNLDGHDISGYIYYFSYLLPAYFVSFLTGIKFMTSRKYHRYVSQNGLTLSRILLFVALWATMFLTNYLLNKKLF